MAIKFQLKRGNKAKLPTLAQGELAFVIDEGRIYAGTGNGSIPMARQDDIRNSLNIYTGTTVPVASLGTNGDIYVKTK